MDNHFITIDELLQNCNDEVKKEPNNEELKNQWADILLDELIFGLYMNGDSKLLEQDCVYKKFKEVVLSEKPKPLIYSAFINLVEGKHKAVLSNVQEWLLSNSRQINCDDFILYLVSVLKEGFQGMWLSISDMMKNENVQLGLVEMCSALETVYYSKDSDEIVDVLSRVIMINDEIYLAKELLGYTYYKLKMWKNAISYLEQVIALEEVEHLFSFDTLYFWLAWAYGATKKYKEEEICYRKSLEIDIYRRYSLNNLGYSLFKQKRYDEAQQIFDQCIDEKRDAPYPANNMVRVLLAKKQYVEAMNFINQYHGKIRTSLIKKANDYKEKPPALMITEDIIESDEGDIYEESSKEIKIGGSHRQFSSEKILEDELILRLEKGSDVLGIPLRVYEQKGIYGRQFIIPVGRLDILAIDDDGNFHVIELKKDSGYDDAYAQTLRYMKWLKENIAKEQQEVYGIICLNSPDDNLIKKVRNHPQMKLFEYSISYSEIK